MEPGLAKYAQEKRISGALLERLNRLKADEGECVNSLIEALNPSANTLRQILELADEICLRDGKALTRLFRSEEIHTVFLENSLSRKEKQQQVRQILERWRYPEKCALEDRLHSCTETLLRLSGFRVQLPKDLEGDSISIKVSARGAKDLLEISKKFKELSEHPTTKELFSILNGEL